MAKNGCALCRTIRLFLLAIVLGGGAGFAALGLGASQDISMLATFAGGIAPLLWLARQRRGTEKPED